MQFVRDWRRRVFGAAIGAVIAPVAIVGAALAVGLGGGGLDGLGALGQALDGPRLPETVALARPGDTRNAGRLLAEVRRTAVEPATSPAGPTTVAAAPTSPTTSAGPAPPASGFDPDTGSVPATQAPPQTAPVPVATPVTPAAPAPPAATPSPLRQVGDTLTDVTDQLPLVGAPTSQVVDGVVDTVDSLLPQG